MNPKDELINLLSDQLEEEHHSAGRYFFEWLEQERPDLVPVYLDAIENANKEVKP